MIQESRPASLGAALACRYSRDPRPPSARGQPCTQCCLVLQQIANTIANSTKPWTQDKDPQRTHLWPVTFLIHGYS